MLFHGLCLFLHRSSPCLLGITRSAHRLAFGFFFQMAPNVTEAMTALKMALCNGNGEDKAAKVRCPRGRFDRKPQTHG